MNWKVFIKPLYVLFLNWEPKMNTKLKDNLFYEVMKMVRPNAQGIYPKISLLTATRMAGDYGVKGESLLRLMKLMVVLHKEFVLTAKKQALRKR